MYHQALDSSAQTTTLNAQMPRPFVRGYNRQDVSRISGSGFSVGLVGNDEPPADMGGIDAMPFLARMARKKGYSQAQIDNFKQRRGGGYEGYTEENATLAHLKHPLRRLTVFQELEKGYTQDREQGARDWLNFFRNEQHQLPQGGKPPIYPKGKRPTFIFNDKKK